MLINAAFEPTHAGCLTGAGVQRYGPGLEHLHVLNEPQSGGACALTAHPCLHVDFLLDMRRRFVLVLEWAARAESLAFDLARQLGLVRGCLSCNSQQPGEHPPSSNLWEGRTAASLNSQFQRKSPFCTGIRHLTPVAADECSGGRYAVQGQHSLIRCLPLLGDCLAAYAAR